MSVRNEAGLRVLDYFVFYVELQHAKNVRDSRLAWLEKEQRELRTRASLGERAVSAKPFHGCDSESESVEGLGDVLLMFQQTGAVY